MRRTATLIVALAIGLAACGGSSGQTSSKPLESAPADVTLPEVTVRNAGTGASVQFASLLPAQKPILFWFWAPH